MVGVLPSYSLHQTFSPFPQLEPMSEAVNGIGNGHQEQATKTVQSKKGALELLESSVVKAVTNNFSSFSRNF